jgi:hypothetical protein
MFGFPVLPVFVALCLAVLGIGFVAYFIGPALRLSKALAVTITRLREAHERKEWDLKSCFDGDATLEHIWSEYQETLHKQRIPDPATGEMVVHAVRSTVPAEVFFSTHAVVDTRIHSEFFKHLPGICTGIGIIGTFGGLIQGVSQFKVSGAADVVQHSLGALLHGVSDAFVVSACAIGLAMLTTLVEKLFVNRLYGQVDRQNQILDSCFEAGAGEEYLARLVTASEEASSQAKILKDALVNDVKQILTDLSERQIAASKQSNLELGEQIAASISGSLRGPLDQIAGAVGQVSQDQSSAVSKLLTDVLAGFAQRMEDLFGSQLSGIAEMQQRTIAAMETAVGTLNEVTANLEVAGTTATDAMSENLAAAMAAAELRQQAMCDQLADLMAQMKSSAAETQSDAQSQMQKMLASMSEQISGAVGALQAQVAERAAEQAEREQRHAQLAAEQIGQVGAEFSRLNGGVGEMMQAIKATVASLDTVSANLVTKLNNGADTLLLAASEFGKSGREASKSFSDMAAVSNGLSTAANLVSNASRSLDSVVSDYKAARDSVAQMVSSLKETAEVAARDASLTSDLVGRIEAAAAKLAAAQQQADGYLEEVSEVLAESHQRFAEGMRQTVGEANTAFHNELTQATSLLRDAIQELEVTLPSGARVAAE